jgi:TPR repeat protein
VPKYRRFEIDPSKNMKDAGKAMVFVNGFMASVSDYYREINTVALIRPSRGSLCPLVAQSRNRDSIFHTPVDLAGAGVYCVLTIDGSCCQAGRGVPPDSMLTAELFQKAPDLGDPAAAKQLHSPSKAGDIAPIAKNSFGICLERGNGVYSTIALTARYYQRSRDFAAISFGHGHC